MKEHDIAPYLRAGVKVHMAGIGGVSMCALAEVLAGRGMVVTGSDMAESDTVRHLREIGIPVAIGHSAEHLGDCGLVVRTAAIHDSNPEIAGAVARGIPVFERAEAWGALMKLYENALCIAGTHGKTTTTAMASHIFMDAHRDPTIMLGGTLPLLGKGYRVGRGDTIILESCEYCNSFHHFFPTVAVVLNVCADHLDFFKDLDQIEESFRTFARITPAGRGWVVYNGDDAGAVRAMEGVERRKFRFSVRDKTADCYAANVSFFDGCGDFDVVIGGALYAGVSLKVPGAHNVSNALAAAASAYLLGVPGEAVSRGLGRFRGASRRFEYKGDYRGARVYDDYAHHPDELQALLRAVSGVPHERVVCAFQPHTYTRTAALFDEFVAVLKTVDVPILAEIYAARESNDQGISSRDLCRQIPGSIYCSTLAQVTERFRAVARPGDLLLTVGAGDIYKAGEALLRGE